MMDYEKEIQKALLHLKINPGLFLEKNMVFEKESKLGQNFCQNFRPILGQKGYFWSKMGVFGKTEQNRDF